MKIGWFPWALTIDDLPTSNFSGYLGTEATLLRIKESGEVEIMSLENSLQKFVKRDRGGGCEAGSILQLNGNVHQLPLKEEGTGL